MQQLFQNREMYENEIKNYQKINSHTGILKLTLKLAWIERYILYTLEKDNFEDFAHLYHSLFEIGQIAVLN